METGRFDVTYGVAHMRVHPSLFGRAASVG